MYDISSFFGFIMAIVRISEPYEWSHFKQDFISKNSSKKPQKFSSEPLLTFVNSVMNIEFVYQILLGTKYFLESNERRKPLAAKD